MCGRGLLYPIPRGQRYPTERTPARRRLLYVVAVSVFEKGCQQTWVEGGGSTAVVSGGAHSAMAPTQRNATPAQRGFLCCSGGTPRKITPVLHHPTGEDCP